MARRRATRANVRELTRFMRARHEIYLRRARGEPPPWTADPVLRAYKFTNVYRELDRQTVWIDERVRTPFAHHPHLWFMLAIARIGCTRETLLELMATTRAWPVDDRWSHAAFHEVITRRCAARGVDGVRAFYAAWQVNHHLYRELDQLWAARRWVEPQLHNTLEDAFHALHGFPGWGGFMRYEVVCDLRHTRYLRHAPDVNTWTQPGPGSMRGLNRVLGEPLTTRWRLDAFCEAARAVRERLLERWPTDWPTLELRDVEHSLCEYDKYVRATAGPGRPKQVFRHDPTRAAINK